MFAVVFEVLAVLVTSECKLQLDYKRALDALILETMFWMRKKIFVGLTSP